ncbi:hypothetical protein E6C55_27875 [Cohnella fermenti]|uniref:Uncharacterized protein n=1 Tax=Cohnella fermenti TaxID=2565925 RepID=A0A4S4BGV7_9BACL|nr:hypothetical protein E6C55_27875 [Cohnella fermenti]
MPLIGAWACKKQGAAPKSATRGRPLQLASWFLALLLPLASCLLPLASCNLPLAACLLPLASCFLPLSASPCCRHAAIPLRREASPAACRGRDPPEWRAAPPGSPRRKSARCCAY